VDQLAFDLSFRPAQGRDDFFVTPCNAAAVGWIDRWPNWTSPGLVVCGPPACGKSHLAEVWRTRSAAPATRLEALVERLPPAILGDQPHLMLDFADGDAVPGDLEEPLLHLYNLVVEKGGTLLLTARTPPARWRAGLADLSSRLRAMAVVPISPPDDAMLTAVLLKQLDDRQLRLSRDAVLYAVSRMERSFEAARALVAALDREAYAQRRRPGMRLVRDILERLQDTPAT
jgi:chromosomal replication initiation ATPase DnaA